MRLPLVLLPLAVLAFVFPAASQPAAPPVPADQSVPAAVELGASDRFAFVADEDASLDHFLYEWARHEKRVKDGPFAARAELAVLPPAEREAWERALAFYSREIAGRDLGFDGGLIELRFFLLGLAPAPSAAAESGALAEIAALLPSYRRLFWPRHRAAAADWTKAYLSLPRLAERETAVARRIAEVFGGAWPEGKIRVDLSPYASWSGAYTLVHESRPFATLSSFDPGYRGEAALEMVFHEATHNPRTTGDFRAALDTAFRAHGATAPGQLAHAIHFFTVGEIARAEAARLGIAYLPYAEEHGLYQGGWAPWLAAIKAHWQPWLDGRGDRAAALAALALKLAPVAENPP